MSYLKLLTFTFLLAAANGVLAQPADISAETPCSVCKEYEELFSKELTEVECFMFCKEYKERVSKEGHKIESLKKLLEDTSQSKKTAAVDSNKCNITNYKSFIRTPGSHKCNLKGANLEMADLEGANLEGANLEGADFGFANLKDVDLAKVNFEGANVRSADFTGENSTDADLKPRGVSITTTRTTSNITSTTSTTTHITSTGLAEESEGRYKSAGDAIATDGPIGLGLYILGNKPKNE